MDRHPIAALACAGLLLMCPLLAVPAAALGQSAGDEQYQDPLGGGGGGEQPVPEPAPAPAPDSAPTPAPTPEAPDATGSVPAPIDPGTSTSPGVTADGGATLPYTGIDARLPTSAGAILLGLGMLLRLRLSGPLRS